VEAKLTPTLAQAYAGLYTDAMTAWRELGARYKAENIQVVCRGRTFGKVLECGAGEGAILQELAKNPTFVELYAVDISESGVAQTRSRQIHRLKEAVLFDGYRLPYADKFFDLVYCSHVLEHVEHPRLLLREIKRVGRLQVFEVPLDYSFDVDQHIDHFLAYGHINIFTPATFKFLLRSEGFTILEERHTDIQAEVTRFIWYQKNKLPKTLLREAKLRVVPLYRQLKRLCWGRARSQETSYAAFTCVAEPTGELQIFK
jgi:ubiquinone/menaquinone biosynthesis C-methylase UbiE